MNTWFFGIVQKANKSNKFVSTHPQYEKITTQIISSIGAPFILPTIAIKLFDLSPSSGFSAQDRWRATSHTLWCGISVVALAIALAACSGGGGDTSPPGKTGNQPSISPAATNAKNPQVAMDSNGDAIITWEQSDGSFSRIYLSEYRSGNWVHPMDLATDAISAFGQDAYDPQVVMDNNGNAIITWDQYDGANSQIFLSKYRSGSWTYPADLTDNISPDGLGELGVFNPPDPQVAMDDNGNAIITWQQYDGTNYRIYMSEFR